MKILFLIAALLTFNVAFCQDLTETEVPSNVLKTFRSEQPNATDIEWEMEKEHYEVEFEIDKADHEMLIDKNGKVLMHKGELSAESLPSKVRSTIDADYADREIDDVKIITKDGQTFYEIELDGKVFDEEILISKEGKVEKTNRAWYNF